MRLAQSCNGEYSNFFGATNSGQVALVLAAFNATLTRCNGCYEKDLAVHLNLIAKPPRLFITTRRRILIHSLGQLERPIAGDVNRKYRRGQL